MKRALVSAVCCAIALTTAAWADDNQPALPSGIVPANVTLSQILKSYDTATGRLTPGTADTRKETWRFTKAGLSGAETLVRSGMDYYARIACGPLVDEYGQFFGHGWHRDPNGVVTRVADEQPTSFEMLILMWGLDAAADPKNDVTVLGEVQTPKPAYVVEVQVSGAKHPEFVWYDKATGLVDRFEAFADDKQVTVTYDDYRTTAGLTKPWHLHLSDGTAPLDYDFVRDSLTIGDAVAVKQFAIPGSTFKFAAYSGAQALPAKVVMSQWEYPLPYGLTQLVTSPAVVVRLTVGGRGLDFALASGQPRSLIDFDVAQQLGLPSYGQVLHAGHDDIAYDTIVPHADIGGLHLRNWAVRATPFHYHEDLETKIVGVIGYDVLSAGVFKLDYDNAKLELFPSAAFDADSPDEVKGAIPLPISVDGGTPVFRGSIDSHDVRVLIDNDFYWSFLFANFTAKHPESAQDAITGGTRRVAVIPFADSKAYGRNAQVWFTNARRVRLGPLSLYGYPMMASDLDALIGGEPIDAVMGADLLKFYDVYLDYPHQRVFLRPNKSFFQRFERKK